MAVTPTPADDAPQLAAWLRTAPRTSGPLDEGALVRIMEALFDLGVACSRAGEAAAYRAALLKSLAAVDAKIGLDLSEGEVFDATHRLREALYAEMMSYRRAARASLDPEALRG